jgi:hypothetical protein
MLGARCHRITRRFHRWIIWPLCILIVQSTKHSYATKAYFSGTSLIYNLKKFNCENYGYKLQIME